MAIRIINRPSIKIEVKDGKYKPFIFDNGKKCYLCNSDEPEPPTPPVPPEPTNRILYTVVEGGTQPTSTWITENCSDNVFDAETGTGELVLKSDVTTVEGQLSGAHEASSIFNDSTDSNVAAVALPSQITIIGDFAFAMCTSLASVTIPESVTSIGMGAFASCSSLTSVVIPESVTSIGMSAFSGCTSLTSVVIPEGVMSIGDLAFIMCTALTSVAIPEGVTSIGMGVFSGCASLASVTIPDSVTSIGEGAFGPSGLTSIIIPDSVTSIGDAAFADCRSLASVTCFATTPPTLGDGVFTSINTTTCGVPEASIQAYKDDDSWSAAFTTFVAADV